MSTAGVGGDAVTMAGRIRVANQNVRNPGGSDMLLDDAVLARRPTGEDENEDARWMVRRLANQHGCKPETEPGNCPDPVAHAANVAMIAPVWLALGLSGTTGGRDTRKDGWGRRQKGGGT